VLEVQQRAHQPDGQSGTGGLIEGFSFGSACSDAPLRAPFSATKHPPANNRKALTSRSPRSRPRFQ